MWNVENKKKCFVFLGKYIGIIRGKNEKPLAPMRKISEHVSGRSRKTNLT